MEQNVVGNNYLIGIIWSGFNPLWESVHELWGMWSKRGVAFGHRMGEYKAKVNFAYACRRANSS
jgi:hypothetical protein